MKATATANANIALVKYWGKRDPKLILPYNGSISMTCDGLWTKTTVEFDPKYEEDTIIINDEELKRDEKDLRGHLDRIRQMAGIKHKAKVVSESNIPLAAGLSSGSAGLAALTVASSMAAGLSLDHKELTILARLGSGSACRSIDEGFVEWYRGEKDDGSDSYAEVIANKNHWPEFRMLAAIISTDHKTVGSRAGMAQTVATCPYYEGWMKTVNEDLKLMREGVLKKDFGKVGSVAEYNAIKMHSTMMTTKPPIFYWLPPSLEVMHAVMLWREEGLRSYFTMDAGPQVKVLCLQKDERELVKRLKELNGVKDVVVCRPGDGATTLESHLF